MLINYKKKPWIEITSKKQRSSTFYTVHKQMPQRSSIIIIHAYASHALMLNSSQRLTQ